MNLDSNTISDTIDKDYKLYANYTLSNRAIPSYIDGFKPVHRKLLWSMLNEHKGKKTKISDLGGISSIGYHHGETSAMGAAITLAASWNNNVPIFKQHGAFGSRLVPAAAAPRYIFASLDEEFTKYFTDFDVMEYDDKDEDSPEPINYLPNIPWVLVNGIEGIAVGFACKYLPHAPSTLAKACRMELDGKLKDTSIIKPTFPNFRGEVEINDHNKFTTYGIAERIKRNTWLIDELPFGITREKYFKVLNKMEQDGAIVDFEDECAKQFKFIIKLNSKQDSICEEDPIKYFKLSKSFTENYTALDENGELVIFDTKAQIIKRFVKYRLKKIGDQLEFDKGKINKELDWLHAKLKFVKDVLNDVINFKTITRKQLTDYCSEHYSNDEKIVSRLVNTSIVDITKDSVKDLEKKIKDKDAELKLISKRVPSDELYERLNELAK